MKEKRKRIKLKEVFRPTPKCPRCKKFYTISRINALNQLVYDCPNCQAVFMEEKANDTHNTKKKH